MIQQPARTPSDRFPVRALGYKRRLVDDELAVIDSEFAAARAKREATLLRIRSTVEELGRAYTVLHEYEWLHAENPTRDPLACFVRHVMYSATCEARSIEEAGQLKARTIIDQGEQLLTARREELAANYQDHVRRLVEVGTQASGLVDETMRDLATFAKDFANRQKDLQAHVTGLTS